MWYQIEITLKARKRGFHLITDEVLNQLPELNKVNCGILHLFINIAPLPLPLMKMPIRQCAQTWKRILITLFQKEDRKSVV